MMGMRSRGWAGAPPRDDAEARQRIVDAALRCIARHGPAKTGLTDVATELGVTRQTVYRHFPAAADLLDAAAISGADAFIQKIHAHVRAVTGDPAQLLTEVVAYTLEALADEWFIERSMGYGAVSPVAIEFAEDLLRRLPIDWHGYGYTGEDLRSLAELQLRLVISFLHSPSDPPRNAHQLRETLYAWMSRVFAVPPTSLQRSRRKPRQSPM